MKITNKMLFSFQEHLIEEEKSSATVEKYLRDVRMLALWLRGRALDKRLALEYKARLCETHAPASVNAAISSLNRFFAFSGRYDLRLRSLKIQRRIYARRERELTKSEYERLLSAAKGKHNERLYLLLQTICATGIRVSELRFISAEAVSRGVAEINCKGKRRQVFLPKGLCRLLSEYLRRENRKSGAVFVTKTGKPLDRSNIWSDMKKLCKEANVPAEKVFPHNLRHLFARTYYSLQKDVVRLADLLGHSNVNTTRIYTIETGDVHRRQIEKLGLLRC